MIELNCDGCGKRVKEADPMNLKGYEGTVTIQHRSEFHEQAYYACKKECIRAAVINALDMEGVEP